MWSSLTVIRVWCYFSLKMRKIWTGEMVSPVGSHRCPRITNMVNCYNRHKRRISIFCKYRLGQKLFISASFQDIFLWIWCFLVSQPLDKYCTSFPPMQPKKKQQWQKSIWQKLWRNIQNPILFTGASRTWKKKISSL